MNINMTYDNLKDYLNSIGIENYVMMVWRNSQMILRVPSIKVEETIRFLNDKIPFGFQLEVEPFSEDDKIFLRDNL